MDGLKKATVGLPGNDLRLKFSKDAFKPPDLGWICICNTDFFFISQDEMIMISMFNDINHKLNDQQIFKFLILDFRSSSRVSPRLAPSEPPPQLNSEKISVSF